MQVRVENLSVTYAQGIGHVSKALDDVSFTVTTQIGRASCRERV